MKSTVNVLVPFAHVADVARSIAFYKKLGFEVGDALAIGSALSWCMLDSGEAHLMLARATGPIDPRQQAVVFYFFTDDVAALRAQLVADKIEVSPVSRPPHMPNGEIRLDDPDGYVLLIGQRRPSA